MKFRRQQPFRGYIVDFYCAALRLALEVDGPIHGSSVERFAYDLERDERLRDHGIAVLRIRPQDVPKLPEILAWWLREHPLSREELSSPTPPERTRPTAMRIATIADAVPLRCVLATRRALASVIVTPFFDHPPVTKTRPG